MEKSRKAGFFEWTLHLEPECQDIPETKSKPLTWSQLTLGKTVSEPQICSLCKSYQSVHQSVHFRRLSMRVEATHAFTFVLPFFFISCMLKWYNLYEADMERQLARGSQYQWEVTRELESVRVRVRRTQEGSQQHTCRCQYAIEGRQEEEDSSKRTIRPNLDQRCTHYVVKINVTEIILKLWVPAYHSKRTLSPTPIEYYTLTSNRYSDQETL